VHTQQLSSAAIIEVFGHMTGHVIALLLRADRFVYTPDSCEAWQSSEYITYCTKLGPSLAVGLLYNSLHLSVKLSDDDDDNDDASNNTTISK
jgi:hypothetical protein